MATNEDRRAAVVLLSLALAGVLVRVVTGESTSPGAVGYRPVNASRPERPAVAERAERLLRPLMPGEVIDVDVAPAEELARLPRIGAGLARRIVAERDAAGPFGSLEGLRRVSGVGERTLAMLRPHVRFSRRAQPVARGSERIRVNVATVEELEQLPGIGPVLAAAIVANRTQNGPFKSLEDLTRVRGIGAKLAGALATRILLP